MFLGCRGAHCASAHQGDNISIWVDMWISQQKHIVYQLLFANSGRALRAPTVIEKQKQHPTPCGKQKEQQKDLLF